MTQDDEYKKDSVVSGDQCKITEVAKFTDADCATAEEQTAEKKNKTLTLFG